MFRNTKTKKRLSILWIIMILVMTFSGFTSPALADSKSEAPAEKMTVVTNLNDFTTVKADRVSIYVDAYDNNDKGVIADKVIVKVNGEPVKADWQDKSEDYSYIDPRINYTLPLQLGENEVEISFDPAYLGTREFTPIKHKIKRIEAGKDESIGHILVTLEGTTVGNPTILETEEVPITVGKNTAQLVTEWMTKHGVKYSSTGSPETGFYLSGVETSGVYNVPAELEKFLAEKYNYKSNGEAYTKLVEKQPTGGGGWMYSVNDTFKSLGMSQYFPVDGDVIRLQFTTDFGADVGGGHATTGDTGRFDIAKKAPLVRAIYNAKKVENPSAAYKEAIKEAEAAFADLFVSQEKCDVLTDALESKDKVKGIKSVGTLADVNVAYNTSKDKLDLPKTVDVTLESDKVEKCKVNWDLDAYNPTEEGAQTLKGTIDFPKYVFSDKKAEVKVVVGEDKTPADLKEISLVDEGGKVVSKGKIADSIVTFDLPWNFNKAEGANLSFEGVANKIIDSIESADLKSASIDKAEFKLKPVLIKDSKDFKMSLVRRGVKHEYTLKVVAPKDATRGIKSVKAVDLTVKDNDKDAKSKLPKTVEVTYTDGKTGNVKVTWDTKDVDFAKAGTYTVKGSINPEEAMTGTVPEAKLTLKVVEGIHTIKSIKPIADVETEMVVNPVQLIPSFTAVLSDGTERVIPVKEWRMTDPDDRKTKYYNTLKGTSGVVKCREAEFPEDVKPLTDKELKEIKANINIKEVEIDMPDSNLRTMVLKAVRKDPKTVTKVTNKDVIEWSTKSRWGTKVDDNYGEIHSLKGLEYAICDKLEIKNIDLSEADLKVLSQIENLYQLKLTNVSSLESLKGLEPVELNQLEIIGGSISDIGDIAKIKTLTNLFVKENEKITKLDGIENSPKLSSITIESSPNLKDFSKIQELYSKEENAKNNNYLALRKMPVTNIDFLEGTYINNFSINGGTVTDFGPFAKMKKSDRASVYNQEIKIDKEKVGADFIIDNPLRDSQGNVVEVAKTSQAKSLPGGKIQLFPANAKNGVLNIDFINSADSPKAMDKFKGTLVVDVSNVTTSDININVTPASGKLVVEQAGVEMNKDATSKADEGKYLYKLPNGKYVIKATKDGYAPYTKEIEVTEGTTINVDMEALPLEKNIENLKTLIAKIEMMDLDGKTAASVKALNDAVAEAEATMKAEDVDSVKVVAAADKIKAAISKLADKPVIYSAELKKGTDVLGKGTCDESTKTVTIVLNEGVTSGDISGWMPVCVQASEGTDVRIEGSPYANAAASMGAFMEVKLNKNYKMDATNSGEKEVYHLIIKLHKDAPAPVVNKGALKAKVEKQTQVESNFIYYNSAADLKKAYDDAIKAGKALLTGEGATQENIDGAVKAINKAMNALDGKLTDTSKLQAAVADKAEVEKTVQYKKAAADKKEAYDNAVAAAKPILAEENLTQAKVDEALQAIETAKAALDGKETDKTKLEAAVADKAKVEKTVKYKKATAAKKEAYDNAVAAGQAVLEKADPTQEEVDQAKEAIETAKAALDGKETDKAKLEAELAKAKASNDAEKYTAETLATLKTAIAKAEALVADENATQEAVDQAKAALTTAIEGLKEIPAPVVVDKTKLEAAVADKAKVEKTVKYKNATAAKKEAYDKAVADAKTLLADENATQEAVDKAKAAIETAKAALDGTEAEDHEPTNPDATEVNKWQMDNAGKWSYVGADGKLIKGKTAKINGNTYDFDENGVMTTGWKYDKGTWYYFNEKDNGTEGAMAHNQWKKVNGNWYYFHEDGKMASNEMVDNGKYYVNKSGAWRTNKWVKTSAGKYWYYYKEGNYPKNETVEINGNKYHFDNGGFMTTGWLKDNGTWYYFNEKGNGTEGAMAHNQWKKVNGKWYYFYKDGKMASKTWEKIGGNWYYFYGSGKMAADTMVGKYYVNKSGAWRTDKWVKTSSGKYWYYFKEGNYPKNRFVDINGNRYHFDNGGFMTTGWLKNNGTWYYFNKKGEGTEGAMVKNSWKKVNGKWYYFYGNGKMAKNTTIKGWKVNGSGAWVK